MVWRRSFHFGFWSILRGELLVLGRVGVMYLMTELNLDISFGGYPVDILQNIVILPFGTVSRLCLQYHKQLLHIATIEHCSCLLLTRWWFRSREVRLSLLQGGTLKFHDDLFHSCNVKRFASIVSISHPF